MDYRSGESGLLPFRTSRIFNLDSNWYFAARDGADYGPFESKAEAEAALTAYLKDIVIDDTCVFVQKQNSRTA